MIAVITTIAEPTESVRKLSCHLGPSGSLLVAVGDKKGPSKFDLEGSVFLSLDKQLTLPYKLARLLPTAHYARKNLGYLWAFSQGAPCIYETDDDNAPNEKWGLRQLAARAKSIQCADWVNVYRFFSDDKMIWPRGLPLSRIYACNDGIDMVAAPEIAMDAPVQQGLADLSPDVDAVWRLVCDRPFFFRQGPNVYLQPGAWCPFNSQNTWWWPEAYVFMYLPSYCSFRMTDIWRSFIAQRCLWAIGKGVLFFAADVVQERNFHNLQKDFEAEIPGYNGNDRMIDILNRLTLEPGVEYAVHNLLACYQALIEAQIFPEKEFELVEAWAADWDHLSTLLPSVKKDLTEIHETH
jgi:hypothetical protein